MDQNGAEKPRGCLVARNVLESHDGTAQPGKLQGKDLTEQSGENCVAARTWSGHQGDEQPRENWVTEGAEW